MMRSNCSEKVTERLIEKARTTLTGLNIHSLFQTGLVRSSIQLEIFNQYPPVYLLGECDEDTVFSKHAASSADAETGPFSLYVHLPFCKRRCSFCGYFSMSHWNSGDIERYVGYIDREIRLLSEKSLLTRRPVASLCWGGGTPLLLSDQSISRLMEIIRSRFVLAPAIEFTCEGTPETITAKKLHCLLRNGCNRLSIGVQTLEDRVLRFLKREYTVKDIAVLCRKTRTAGFPSVNLDLLFNLPLQTVNGWAETLRQVVALQPDSVTAYSCADTYNRPLVFKTGRNAFPTEEDRLLMHVMFIEAMKDAGYTQITPYQFLRSWKYSFVQQELKACNGEILALGLTGHSYINRVYYHNHYSIKAYTESIDKGRLPIHKGRRLNKQEQMIRYVVSSLQKSSGINRKHGGADAAIFKELFGVSMKSVFGNVLRRLEGLQLIHNDHAQVQLSYRGLLFPIETVLFFYLKRDRDSLLRIKR